MIRHHPLSISEKAEFAASSEESETVSTSSAAPSYMSGCTLSDSSRGFELVSALRGEIRNVTGRTLKSLSGTFSFQPSAGLGAPSTLFLFSERSIDGIVWVPSLGSLRSIEIRNTIEEFKTVVSYGTNWLNNEIIRFRIFSTGAITLAPPSISVLAGITVTGPSMFWQLSEN